MKGFTVNRSVSGRHPAGSRGVGWEQNRWVLSLTFVLVTAAACQPSREEVRTSLVDPGGEIPRVDRIVLITIDTLRADHLGCYGYPRRTSPFLDRLAAEGVLFTSAFSAMATTVPSHAAMFTGLYPIQNGVRKNGHQLDEDFLTLAEFLRSRGFLTAGFVSLLDSFYRPAHLDQGFQVFRVATEGSEPISRFQMKELQYRPADQTVASANRWLDGVDAGKKFFLWVHLFDPHTPYHPAHRFPRGSGEQREEFARFLLQEQRIDPDFYGSEEEMLEILNAYDGEVVAVDRAVEELMGKLRERSLDDDLLFVVTGDHGEGLGNHRWAAHGKHIYNEQIRVPLILHFSSGAFSGRVIEGVVELVDILPTVADLLRTNLDGQVLPVEGRSLLPLFTGSSLPRGERFALSQRRDFDPDNKPETVIPEETNYEGGEKFAFQNGRFKYIMRTSQEDEFYRIEVDPYETVNLIGRGWVEEEQFRERLLRRLQGFQNQARGSVRSVDSKAIDMLRSLGYLQ